MQTGAASGLQNVLGQQQATAGQLQGIANGTGPNPAQAALNNATGQNIASQAALMAGQRGAGANVGLMARQAAQQGAGIQQQAVGQGAEMQAQQQLAALGQLSGQQQAMAGTNSALAGIGSGLTGQQQGAITDLYGQGTGAVGLQQAGLGQQFGQGTTMAGQQMGQFGANAGIAQNQVANQMGATGTNMQGNISNAGQLIGAGGQYNTTQAGQQASVNTANAGMAQTRMGQQGDLTGGLLNAGGGMLKALAAEGGEVVRMADGGIPAPMPAAPVAPIAPAPPAGPQSSFGQFLQGWGPKKPAEAQEGEGSSTAPSPGDSALKKGMQKFGEGAGSYLSSPSAPAAGALAGPDSSASSAMLAARGGGVVKADNPKQKAVAKGNDYANDKIPAMLSEGEVVIPRDVMQSKDPARSAADFVSKVMAKRRNK